VTQDGSSWVTIANAIYNALLHSFHLQVSVVYLPLQQSLDQRLLELVPAQSRADLEDYCHSIETPVEADESEVLTYVYIDTFLASF